MISCVLLSTARCSLRQIRRRSWPCFLTFHSPSPKTVFGEGEWKVKKHGQERRRIWRKLHLAVDSKTHEIICAEMDEQWGYVGAKSRQRWLFYAYDRIRRTVVAHVFGERTLATLERLLSLLSAFEVVVWMTDGWPLYESRLKGKLHVNSKRYTQRIERHNLNLRQHLARLGRKSLSFSKSVELHDKVIGHYLNIKHYQ
ncbi:insertion element protein [Klebsiella pneumoniae]|nr:insertion element protein [Klebsiella pneumoniae]